MHDMLGVACAVFTITNSSSDYICATRAQGMASHFSFHNIRDDFEPKGVAEHWIQKINHAHGTFNRSMGRGYGLLGGSTSPTTEHSGEKWDEFMSLSVGLFMPDLSQLLARWKANTLAYRARTYVNSVDGVQMYVLMTVNRFTGAVMEFHGLSVAEQHVHEFEQLEAQACQPAFEPGWEAAVMHKWWHQTDANGVAGLPHSIVVKISHPSNDPNAAKSFLSNYAHIDSEVHKADDGCLYSDAGIKNYAGPGYVNIKFVHNPLADQIGEATTADYIATVEEAHHAYLGTQSGWDRFLDAHIGLVYVKTYVDALAPALAEGGIGFHAHADVYTSDPVCMDKPHIEAACGSIWTEGVSGLGIEMHSFFDYSYFNGEYTPEYIEFCSLSSDDEMTEFTKGAVNGVIGETSSHG